MIADRIKYLREMKKMSQTELAKRLSITRSSVNAWEMGISVPSTQYIVELAEIFKISTDYLLGVDNTVTVNVSGLTDADIQFVHSIISYLREKNGIQN